jgi:hypothetical protein
MTGPARYLIGVSALALAAAAAAQTPSAKPPTAAELDKLAVDVLRDVHNRGAELYNRGDPAGCYRMYEGALLTVRPFLAHRPAVQKLIDDGITEVAGKAAEGPKVQAFRLHEVIEQVRAELKKADTPKPDPGAKPKDPAEKPKDPAGGDGMVSGTVTLDGQPLADGGVAVISLGLPKPRVFTAGVKDGVYKFDEPIPPGQYVVLIGGKVPDRYRDAGTSGLRVEVAGGANAIDLALKSK